MLARFARQIALSAMALLLPLAPGVAHAASAAAAEATPRAVLWKIEKTGVPASYLFGTIHVGDPRVTALSEPVSTAFANAEHVYTEVRMDFSMMMELAKSVIRPEGDLLSDHIDAAHYQKLLPQMEAREYPEVATRRLYTWAAAMIMMYPPRERGQLPLDLLLAKMSVEGGKDYQGLETIGEQLGLFSGMPEDKQKAMLNTLIDHPDDTVRQQTEAVDAYLARDFARLSKVSEQPDAGLSATDAAWFSRWLQGPLLTDRNHRFVARMQDGLTTGNAFIAIGAAHLPGKEGVISLLRQAGYTLTPVFDTPATQK
ncbi:TraB/GumN family protein [Silvimonas sp. JCM 19000]